MSGRETRRDASGDPPTGGRVVPLARRNLFQEKWRFAMSVSGVAFAVLLILIVVSLYRGWSDVGRLYERLPGDVWISQTGTSDPFHSTSFLPAGDAAEVARIPGVAAVIPVYARHIAFRHGTGELDVFAMALDAPRRLPAARGHAAPLPSRRPATSTSTGCSPAQAGVGVGDRLDVLGRPLVVSGIHSGGASIFQTASSTRPTRARSSDRPARQLLPALARAGRGPRRGRARRRRSRARLRDPHERGVRHPLREPRQPGLPRGRRGARGDRLRRRRRGDRADDVHGDGRARTGVRRAEGGRSLRRLPLPGRPAAEPDRRRARRGARRRRPPRSPPP